MIAKGTSQSMVVWMEGKERKIREFGHVDAHPFGDTRVERLAPFERTRMDRLWREVHFDVHKFAQ